MLQDMTYPDDVLMDILRGLTGAEMKVLGALYENIQEKRRKDEYPGCLPSEITTQLRMNGSSFRAAVAKLEGAGLVKTAPGFADGRTRVIELRANAYRAQEIAQGGMSHV